MDEHVRARGRAAVDTDPEALVSLLHARLRAGERADVHEAYSVGGPLLAVVLRYLLESSGQREIEVLRASSVEPKHHGRWIRMLRDFMGGETYRSWVWVQRWSDLLGFDEDLLALAVEMVPPPLHRAPPVWTEKSGWQRPDSVRSCRACRHLRYELTAQRAERAYCGEASRGKRPIDERRIEKPKEHTCPAFEPPPR
jgi:hypothetical protein